MLLDTFNNPMPGVLVQERFVTPVPPNFTINSDNQFWVTLSLSTQSTNPSFNFALNSNDGYFNLPDTLWAAWFVSSPVEFDPIHIYYAGTKDIDPSKTTGVRLGAYQIRYVPGQPTATSVATLNPGDPGSASQSKSTTP